MPCWFCIGSKQVNNEDCQICNGIGTTKHNKPPKKTITPAGSVYFDLYVHLKQFKIWPNNGGLSKQNSKFIKVIDFCDRVHISLNEIEAEEKRVQSELARKMGGAKS